MLLCFLLAATFWVLKALNKKYENVRISYPISFIYDPEKLIPVTEPPTEIIINVNGKGWKLLRKTLNLRIQPALIDLTQRNNAKFLTSRQLRPALSSALDGLDLNYIVTDTVYFNFERRVSRTISLALQLPDTVIAPGFQLNGKVKITPAKIRISGPASLVAALPDPYPLNLPDSNLTQDYQKEILLGFVPENLLKPDVQEIAVALNIIPLQNKQMQVPVSVRNRDSISSPVTVKPNYVKLAFQVASADSGLTANQFKVEADLTKINLKDSTVTLKIIQKPAGAKTVSVLPQKVKIVY